MATSWKPPADQVTTDSGWRPPASAVTTDAAPQDNRRWDQKAGEFLQPLANAADRIQSTIPMAAAAINPGLGMAQYAGAKINEASGAVAEPVTEAAGRAGVPGIGAAALGLGASVVVNPMTWTDPMGAVTAPGKFMKPVVPASRAFDVATAEKYGLPLTRADKTGGIGDARIETGLSGTITGGGPFQRIAARKLQAIETAKAHIGSKFGTRNPLSASGIEAKMSMQEEMGAAGKTARDLYKQVPDVEIQVGNLNKAINDLDFGAIDKGASATIQEIRGRLGRQSPATEETFPQPLGSGKQIRDVEIPPAVKNIPGEGNVFEPGRTARMESTLESQYRVGPKTPEAAGLPRYQQLNDIRNLLSKEIQSDTTYNPIMGNQVGPKAQTLIPLKKAIDLDFQEYIGKTEDPLGKMQASEFETAFGKANTYYGALKGLKNNKFVQKLSRVTESDIPKTVFGSGKIEDINVAKAALGQKGFNAAKQQFFNDLLEEKNIDNALSKYEPEFLRGVFNSKELNALREAGSLKRTSLTAEKLAGNPSGTAQRLMSGATGVAMLDALRRAITHPLHAVGEAAVTLGAPYLGTKAYLAASEGVPYSYGTGSTFATKAATSSSSSARKDLHAEFIKRYIKRGE